MPNTPNFDLEKPEHGALDWDVPLNSNMDKLDAHAHPGGTHNQIHAINGADHTGTLDDSQIPATIARDTEVSAAVTSHEAAVNPHPTYLTQAEGDALYPSAAIEDVTFLVGTASGLLSSEIPVGVTPGGELGGTWGAPTVDATHSGSTHAGVVSAHEAAGDPHTGYRLESADHSHATTGLQAGTIDHGVLTGLGDDDHPQYATDTDLSDHAAAADPHAGYRLESADHTHASTGAQAGLVSHDVLSDVSANDHHNQAHVLDSSDHTISGKAAGQFLRATSATTFAFEAIVFSRGATLLNSSGVATVNLIVWRAPFACTVTAVKGYRVGGTGATINARRNGTDNHLASALSLSSADTWMDGGAVQNTAYAAGDKMEIMVVSVTGTPSQIAVQVDLTRP